MPTKSQHNGLSSDDRSQIRSAILSSREMLESEFERQLERYGVYDDDRVPLSKLGHLSLQERETRREIDAVFERELEATEDYQRAYRNYIREATKEYLNRCVGLKTIEARGLVTETLTTKAEYGNRSYLHYTVDEIAGELTDASDDGLGVALDLAFQEIGAEIRILFEDTDYTAIEPEFTVRRDVFEELGNLDDDAWAADEAIGWVYQYFGEKEREEIDERIQDHNYKVQDTDIATKTQLFTPRYIVEYLVDNSLGRMWLEMYGSDTSINNEDNCFYLAPVEESLTNREQKDPREITVLDPACGGGHFLFYAFDVLYEMYQERTDVVESHIPREILKNNLYGIDIDSGAVQLAALALYLKAKTIEPDVTIEKLNIISADAVLINGEKKEQVLNEVELDIEERLIEQIWTSFEHVREWGSLVNIKERVEELIEEEREELEKFQKQGQARLTSDGKMVTQSSFITEQEGEISWEELKERLMNGAREIAQKGLEQNSVVDEMFAGEVEKSVELLDILMQEYDIVVANPPYLQSSKMGDNLKELVSNNYTGKRDLYGAFIERCLDFNSKSGYIAMVTQENFMFTSSFESLREKLLAESTIVEGAHLARYSFDQQKDRYTIPFVLKSESMTENTVSKFYRMTHEQSEYEKYEDKISGLNQITDELRKGHPHEDVYEINPNMFNRIDSLQFIYWFGQEVLNLFDEFEPLSEYAKISGGVKTGDNDEFLRKVWEVPNNKIGDGYQWYVHNGDYVEYYDKIDTLIRWENSGQNIVKYSEKEGTHYQGLSNPDWYFSEAIIYRDLSRLFVAKYIPDDCVFSHSVYRVDPNSNLDEEYLLAFMNSTLYRYIASGINPTLHYNPSDAGAVPIKDKIEQEKEIKNLVSIAKKARERQFHMDETSMNFSEEKICNAVKHSPTDLLSVDDETTATVQIAHGFIDEIIFDEFGLSTEVRTQIYEDNPKNLSKHPYQVTDSINKHIQMVDKLQIHELSESEYEQIVDKVRRIDSNNLREISERLGISPYTVAKIRREFELYSSEEKEQSAGRLLSYLIGLSLGHWPAPDAGFATDDNILIFDQEFENNISDYIHQSLEYLFDNPQEINENLQNCLGRDVQDWIKNKFFRYHHCKQYRRRGQRIPIFWHLESKEETFGCIIYYHSLDSETLPKLRGQYVDKKIQTLKNRIRNTESELESDSEGENRELRNKLEELQGSLEDVEDFGARLDALIDDGFEPDFEAGIWENIQKVDEYDLLQTELDKL